MPAHHQQVHQTEIKSNACSLTRLAVSSTAAGLQNIMQGYRTLCRATEHHAGLQNIMQGCITLCRATEHYAGLRNIMQGYGTLCRATEHCYKRVRTNEAHL